MDFTGEMAVKRSRRARTQQNRGRERGKKGGVAASSLHHKWGGGGGQQDCRGPPVARTPPGPAGQEQPKGGRMWAAPAHPLQQNSCQWFSHLHARCPPRKAEFSEVGTMFRSLYIRCLLYIFKYLT